mgnify:CR=1 FL=1
MRFFDEKLRWYKGNLHTHTSVSDGKLGLEECMEQYRNAGYDFLAITDHRTVFEGLEGENFLVIRAAEYDINDLNTRRAYHVTAIGIDEEIHMYDCNTPQEMMNAIIDRNGLAIVAHPAWSLLTHEDLLKLENYHGIEIWNNVSETHSCRGDSTNYADVLASKGRPTLMFAVDDTHFYTTDLFGGYIMVNSESLDRDSIIKNIKAGRFYCSQAPEITQIELENNRIKVVTSPVSTISFISDTFFCGNRICRENDRLLTEAVYEINTYDRYVRIECTDENGKKAWSQFISV